MKRGGPATENGKEIVRWNATRHGISSPAPVIPGLEKREDWQDHRDGILDNLSPVGHLEFTLAERVALLSWRLHRVTRYETESIAISQGEVEGDIQRRARFLRSPQDNPYECTHPEDIRTEAKYRRQTHNALKRLPSLEPGKIVKGEDVTSIVQAVLEAAQRARGEEIDVEHLDLPGLSDDDYYLEELPDMKAEDVRGYVQSIARAASQEPERMLEFATNAARWEAQSAKAKVERVEGEIDVMRRERLLPDDKTLEKIHRYEAHLSKQLYHALHELESIQKRRTTGEGTPLARLDVQGLPET
jgi:hypothetical protein